MNAWQEWLEQKQQTGLSSEFPEYYNEVIKKRGLLDSKLAQGCKGCVHLRHVIIRDKKNRNVILADYYECSMWGAANKWQPTWPACKDWFKNQKDKKGAKDARA